MDGIFFFFLPCDTYVEVTIYLFVEELLVLIKKKTIIIFIVV